MIIKLSGHPRCKKYMPHSLDNKVNKIGLRNQNCKIRKDMPKLPYGSRL